MALTNNNLEMIKAIANNDVNTAKKAALASLTEDTSKKNASIITYYKKILVNDSGRFMMTLPNNVKTYLVGETPGNFNIDRYYIRKCEQDIVDTVIKMKLVADEMSIRKIPYKNTLLLYGESGTGKTELGRYIAYKLNLPFFYISFSSIIDSHMGSTAKNIHSIFDFCKTIPCILMLDELDCIAMKRSSIGSKGVDGEIERTTISIMQEIDNLPNHVTLIAATNRLDIVDEALLRRFSIKHEITNMTEEELKNLTNQYCIATNTVKYIKDDFINNAVKTYKNPGQIMPEIIREIGINIYEEIKDTITEPENEQITDLFEVTYTWKQIISAQTEEDAISIAKHNRTTYNTKNSSEQYSAKPIIIE